MEIAIEKAENCIRIVLEGSVDVGCAAELKMQLLEALQAGGEVCVSLAKVAYLDVTAVQLLWAAQRQADACGTAFRFEGQMAEAVAAGLTDAGLSWFLREPQDRPASEGARL